MGSDCCKCADGNGKPVRGTSSDGSGYRIRGDRPMPPNRYRLQMRGNIVQLTLKQSQKDDTGQYALVATRIGQPFEKGSTRRIHLRVDEPGYEEGEPPIFLRRLTDLAVKVGTRTRFLVEIRSPTNPKVTWHRNDLPIRAGSRFSFVHEGNFYCVDVAPVKVEDEGNWTCMAENESGRSSCTSHLSVIVPKAYKRPEFVEELRALLTETGTVSLECKVVGVPTPVLRWFKDNKEIKAGDVFALTANPDDPTSLGIYTCEADNCMGTAYSSSKVHVVGKGSREGSLKPADALTSSGPPPVFKRILRDECCRIGDSVTLACQVHVPPWPRSITWYNQEGRIEPNEKYHVMEDGLGGYSIEVKLVEAMDEGEWKCVATSAENVKQFTTCHVAVIIPKNYRKPRFMESLKAVLTEEGLVSFECKVVGFPTPLLRWFKDGQELKPGDVYQLTGTNSLGSYCCIARNCMGEAKSTAELTIEDIQNQLNEEERLQLLSSDKPPKFIRGLRSCEAKINEELFRFTVQVSISPEPNLSWYRDDVEVVEGDKFRTVKENLGTCHLEVRQLEISDQAEWKCVASNDYGHSVTSCFLKLIIPKHYKKPKFLESLRAILSEEGAVNLECKVIGVPQPILKWYKDGVELKPGDIHRIITGQDGTCCLGTYTCEAINCMGTVSSSASLLGFEDKINARKDTKEDVQSSPNGHELARNLSLSTIHEERTSQLYDTPQTDRSVTLDDRGEVSFSFDGKEVSVSLYETPDLTEEEALQIVEMYADQLSEHVTEHNVIELPPMRFVKESSTSGNLLMEAVVIDVSPDYFVSAEDGDDLRTEADFEDVSIMDDQTRVFSSPEDESLSLKRSARYSWEGEEIPPTRPPRKKSTSRSSSKSEGKSEDKSQRFESESFHSARKDDDRATSSPLSSERLDESECTTFADALSSARLSISEQNKQNISVIRENEHKREYDNSLLEAKERRHSLKRKLKREKSTAEESASSITADLDGGKEEAEVLDKKGEPRERADVEDTFAEINVIEEVPTMESADESPSRNNKERILNQIKRLTVPVVAIRDSLVEIDRYDRFLEVESEELSRDVILEGIVRPIQTLCEEVSSMEAKALKNTEDRSLGQTIRISLLEGIGGPTEELLRGIELIDGRRSFKDQRSDVMAILESLTDPVDEILMALTRIEYELIGKAKGEKPVSFLRMCRAVTRLDERLKEYGEPARLLSYLDRLVNTLNSFLQDVSINPTTGTIGTVDTVLVESLSKSIEETVRAFDGRTKSTVERRPSDAVSRLNDRLLQPTRELKAKLDTLTAMLATCENKGELITERRAELMVSLRESVNDALGEIVDFQEKVGIEGNAEEREALRDNDGFFEDARLALREAIEIYETISGSLDPRFAAVFDGIAETYENLCSKGKEVNAVERLLGMEERLKALRDAITYASAINDSANVLKLLAPSVSRLTVAAESLSNLSSAVRPILSICSNIDDIVQGRDENNRASEKARYSPSVGEARLSALENLLDPLIEIQATLSAAIRDLEDAKSAVNGDTARELGSARHEVSSVLVDLRQCISDAAHAAMSSKEGETFRCLADLKEPLSELRAVLASKDAIGTLRQSGASSETISASIGRLQDALTMILPIAPSSSYVTETKEILEMLKEIRVNIPSVPEDIVTAISSDRKLEDLNVDEKLGSVNYSLTAVLEKRKRTTTVPSLLANSVEALRENVASSAVAIATLETPKDDATIAKEVSKLGEPLSSLQRALLTVDHEAEELGTLYDLINPIGRLKTLTEDIARAAGESSSIDIVPVLELLEEMEKDVTLIAKETSKRKDDKSTTRGEEGPSPARLLADTISRSLDPIRGWLSSPSEPEITRDVVASAISSSIDELKRDLTRMATEASSYSEPPSDRSLIEALAELRGPLMRLKNAITMYHEPEDISALETLSRPMRYLLKTIERVLKDHGGEESLCLILDVVEDIENRIPISIKEALYKRELGGFVQSSEDNISGKASSVMTDVAIEPSEARTEHGELDEESRRSVATREVVRPKDDTIAIKDFVCSLSRMLENVQLVVTGIVEDSEEPTTGSMAITRTKLCNALEEFCKTISTVRMALTSDYDVEIPSAEEPLSMIDRLLEPLTMIEEALNSPEELYVAELTIMERLKGALDDTGTYILLPCLELASGKDRSREKFERLVRVLEGTKASIPVAAGELSSRKEILGYLRDISKPLESIEEQMRGLEAIPEETLEKDVAKILLEPIDNLLGVVKASSQQTRILDQRKEVMKEMRRMTGPLVEFLSCLSVVKSSRKSLVPEATLLDERKNVILKATEGLRLEICDILEGMATRGDGGHFEESLTSLNDAILSVRSQLERTDYAPRPSGTSIRFQNYFVGSLNRLGLTIDALEKETEKSPWEFVAKSLEPLKKQISLSRSQFSQTSDRFVDEEEVIVEGFLYPTNQLRSALGALKESIEKGETPPFTCASLGSLENLAASIADLAHTLSSHRAALISEGASEGSSIVETFSAALEVLEKVQSAIRSIRDMTLDRKATELLGKVGATGEGYEEEEVFGEKAREENVGNESQGRTDLSSLGSSIDERIELEMSQRRRLVAEEREEKTISGIDEIVEANDESGAKLKLEERLDGKLETFASKGILRVEAKDEKRSAEWEREEATRETKFEEGIVEPSIERILTADFEEQSAEKVSSEMIYARSAEGKKTFKEEDSITNRTKTKDELVRATKEEAGSATKLVEEILSPTDLDESLDTSLARHSNELQRLGENGVTGMDVKPDEPRNNESGSMNAGAETAKAIISEVTDFAETKGNVRVDKNADIIKRIVSTMGTLEAPMKNLTEFIDSAKKEPLTVKSEEENRKIRELTALIQILNDLRATSVSVRCSPAFSAYSNSEDLFSNIINSVDTMERATAGILVLTQERLLPELKEKSLLALKSLAKPLESIEKSFSAVLRVEGITRLTTEDRNGLSKAMGDLVGIVTVLKETVRGIDDAISVTRVELAKPNGDGTAVEITAESPVDDLQTVPKDSSRTLTVPPREEEITRETVLTRDKVKVDEEDVRTPIDRVERSLETFDTSTVVETEDARDETTMLSEVKRDFQEQREAVTIDRVERLPISIRGVYVESIENVIGSILELRGSLSRTEEGRVALVRPLEESEESLRRLATRDSWQEEPFPVQRAKVASVLEELEKSMATIEERITRESVPSIPSETSSAAAAALSLKKLQSSTATLRQLFDRIVVESPIEIEGESLVRANDRKDVERARRAWAKAPTVRELRGAIEDLVKSEIEETGTLEESGLAFALTTWVEPLERLENTFFSMPEERLDAHPLEESSLPTTTLEDLRAFVRSTEECLAIGRNKLSSIADTESSSLMMRKATESLEDLKTSIAIVDRSAHTAEDSGERLSSVENVPITALKDLARAVMEVKRDCTVVLLESKNVGALEGATDETTPILENVDVISPVRLLQESIETIERWKIDETEEFAAADERKPVRLLSTLVDPLQRLEKMLVAGKQGERAIYAEKTADLSESVAGAEASSSTFLSPILEEVDKTLASVQEQATLEVGAESPFEGDENLSLSMRTMAEPLVELRASIAAIQRVEAEIATEPNWHVSSDKGNVNAFETFARTLYEFAERIAAAQGERVAIFEAGPDATSEVWSTLRKARADVAEDEFDVKVTRATMVERGIVDSPTEAVSPFSEEEDVMLRTLAKPLEELREFLALIVEERRTTETTSPLIPKTDASSTRSIAKPLLELGNVAAMVIEEKLAIESAREKAFDEEGGGSRATSIDPLVQPLEEVCRSIAIIQDQIPVESLPEERSLLNNELALLSVLAEPLLDLHRCILVLEERVISPDVEPLPEESSKDEWTTKGCVAVTTLQEIERSIAEICESVSAVQADTVEAVRYEPSKITTEDRIIVECLIEPIEGIVSVISNLAEETIPRDMPVEREIECQALKTLLGPLKVVSDSFSILRDEADYASNEQEEANVEAIVESLSNLERCISIVEEQAIGKPLADPLYASEADKYVTSASRLALLELKGSILKVEDSPTEYLRNLEKPLKDLRAALEAMAVRSVTRDTLTPSIEMTKLSIKLLDAVVGINESVESLERKIRDEIGRDDNGRFTELEQLITFNGPIRDFKRCMVKIQEEGTLEKESIMLSLSKIHESIVAVRERYTSESDPRSTDTSENRTIGILRPLSRHFDHLDDIVVTSVKAMAREGVTGERLETLEKPLRNLYDGLKDLRDKLFSGEIVWMTDVREESRQGSDADRRINDKTKDTEKLERVPARGQEETDEKLKAMEIEMSERQDEERELKEVTVKRGQEEEESTIKEEAEDESRLKVQKERKRKEEAERPKREEEEREKREGAEKMKLEEAERKKKGDADKLKLEEEEREKIEEAERLKHEEGEEREKNEEDKKIMLQEEERKKKEEVDKVKLEEETEKFKREEDERKKREEAEQLKLKGEERKEKEEAERSKLDEEEERKRKEEADRLKLEEEERKRKEEDEKLQLEEEERRKKEEIEKVKFEEGEREKREEEDERKKKEEAEKLRLEDEERKRREEAEKLRLEEEEERKRKEEAERLRLEEEGVERKKQEEVEKLLKLEEEERKKRDEAEKLKLEEEERKKKEEAEKLKLEEEERKKKEEAEKLKLEEEERKKKEEAEKLKLEEEERKKKEEAEKLKLEEEERKKREEVEEAEKVKLEEEKEGKKKKEDADKAKLEEEKRKRKEGSVEEEGKKEEEGAKAKVEEEDRKEEDDPSRTEVETKEMKDNEMPMEDVGKGQGEGWAQPKKEEVLVIREKEEDERSRKRKERRRIEEEETLRREVDVGSRSEDERRKRKEETEQSRKDREESSKKREMERLERKRAEERRRREDFGRMRKEEEERMSRREKERQLRREESARMLKEEEDRLRRRHEEELSAINKRRRERARDENWSRLRENESERLLKSLDDARSRSGRSSRISPDRRDRLYRVDSDLQLESTLSDSSRSYSWRESLASSGRRSIDDYMDYKLRESSLNRSIYDVESYYGTRRRREERINRARSISLLKYDEYYYMGDTDSTFSYSSSSKPPRYGRIKIPSRIEYDDLDSSSFDSIVQDKGKKPSFCTRLTNRTVGEGMRTRLTCTVLGHPEPRVYWRKDGQELSPTSNKYQTRFDNGMAYFELNEARVEDSGVYACVAENIHGSASTESALKVYRDFVQPLSPPTFTKSIKDTYRQFDRELILECRVRGYPSPTISWLKDGKVLDDGRYTRKYLDDGIYRLEISNPDASDSGRYVCRASNEMQSSEMSHIVRFEGRDRGSARRSGRGRITEDDAIVEASRRPPRFSSYLSDHSVPTGGTIALQVEVKGMPAPEVRWFHGERKEPISLSKAKTFAESGVHTLIVPEATESERGTYICRAVNAYGYVDTAATIEIISPGAIDGGKPAMFVSRPSERSIAVAVGEDVSVSFRVTGVPKPRVTWMKGIKDITDGPRTYKEAIDDYVRLTLKRAIPSDEGTYCILVKNRYGCDRSFFSISIKQRARSLTPLPDWSRSDAGSIQNEDELSYVKDVPGPISSEPVVVDGGRNWLSLSWGKAERRGPAPVIAYKVDAWLLGGDGGARWVELGITPLNALDAFNLRPGGEYKFRVTPRNRYGWGESVTTSNSFTVGEVVDLPEFIKILPGQSKALEGSTIELECEIRGDPNINIKWYRETNEIDPSNDSRYSIGRRGLRCSLTINDIKEDDSGRYICEASNKVGKVSSFARVLVVTDPKIIEADEKLRSRIFGDEREERPPQFAMRLRDRRVQVTYPVRLTCQIMGSPAPEITWFKNAVEITQDERHVFWDDDSNFHTLEIIHSTLEDSGCYMVTAKNIHGSVSCRSVLVVDKGIRAYVAPEFLYGLDAAYAVRSNDELRMSARIEAYPSVGVVWHRDGLRLRPSRRTVMTLSHDGTVELSLAKVTSRDAGVYGCTAINEVGRAETSTRVNVIVGTGETDDERIGSLIEGLPTVTVASPDVPYSKEPLFVTKPLSTEALEGDTVIILCEVVGDPKPEVIWLRDFLKPDYYRDAPHFRLVGNGPRYRLEIPHAKLDFTGTYSVIARNCHGEAKAIISLQIYAKGQGKETTMKKSPITHGKVLTLPMVTRELRDIRCCDGDAVTLECKFLATPERTDDVRWEKGGKIITMGNDFTSEFDGEVARLSIQHVYPEDEGEYTCVAYNELGKAFTSACLVVDVPEGKENVLSERLTRPVGLLSAGSTPRSTPRSTPIRSLSPAVSHGRELRSPQLPRRCGSTIKRRPKISPPKFYSVPHNRVVEEGETVRFQCAVVGHPTPWLKWDKNGIVVTPTTRISIVEKDDVKILEIGEVTQEDAGLYRVTLENDFGRIEASARLEVINRHGYYGRTIRTRSASPRIHPSFSRSLLDTTARTDGRLRLQCGLRGSPGPTPTWYRNGRPLPRSNRIKRHFDGKTAKIEISKVKPSDAGEYACVATNVLGSARNTCQVAVLEPHDSSTLDKEPPKFLQSLPKESIVMEGTSYEFRTRLAGTPPFSIDWSKDKREIPEDDRHDYVTRSDGGIALRLFDVHPRDAGEYACVVRNEFGETSCSGLLAVQDYKAAPNLAPRFTKTPLTQIVSKGETARFCARVQCGKPMDFLWTVNGKDVRDNARCEIEVDENVSILKIRDVSARDTGEIRCTASVLGNGPSICCTTELRLNRVSSTSENRTSNSKRERKISHNREKSPSPSFDRTPDSKLVQTLTSSIRRSKKERHLLSTNASSRMEETFKRTRSSSLPLRTKASSPKRPSPLPKKKNAVPPTDPPISKSKKNKSNETDLMPFTCTERSPFTSKTNNEYIVPDDDESFNDESNKFVAAAIVKAPSDVKVFRGNKLVLRITYRGHPEPLVKWFRAGRELTSEEKIGITYGAGVSHLTLDDITADNAGKYEVSVENLLARDRQFFSLAVEGPPDPPTGVPSVTRSKNSVTIAWRSPAYDGGCTITGYTIEMNRREENCWTVIAESCHSLSHTVLASSKNSIVAGESYRFRVRGENIHGVGEPSAPSELVRIPREGETILQNEEEEEFPAAFEARTVRAEDSQSFVDRYDVFEELGKGRYGVVKRVVEKSSKESFAAKFVRTIKSKDREQVREEINIMNMLRHPKLLLLAAAFEGPREIIMVTEYISGGELFERVVADDFTLTERDSMLFMRQICEGVEYMHKNNVVHLDLKPENIMCRTRTSHKIKLIDFGLAQTLKPDTPIRVLFGTPEFIPPEIISYEPIGTESDMWSVGVICYVLLTGLSPFMGDNDAETFANITRADYDLDDEAFDAISNDAKDFITGLLVKRKESRMSSRQCLEHPWMAQHAESMSRVALPTDKLKKFIVRRKWQKTGNAIRALGRMAILSANSRKSSPTRTTECLEAYDSANADTDNRVINERDKSIEPSTSTDGNDTNDTAMTEPEDDSNCSFEIEGTRRKSSLYSFCYKTEVNISLEEESDGKVGKREDEDEDEDEDEEEGITCAIDNAYFESTRESELAVEKENENQENVGERDFANVERKLSETDLDSVSGKFQNQRRVFRGDSRDSGIADCSSNLATSSLQLDELGIVSIIEEETDNEISWKSSRDDAGSTEATSQSSLIKASRETNPVEEDANKNQDARMMVARNREKFVPTGNVSRTAKMFEQEAASLKSSAASQIQIVHRAYPAATMATGKPHNERIQRVFAFWNK